MNTNIGFITLSIWICVACNSRVDIDDISEIEQPPIVKINPKKISKTSFFNHFEVIEIIPLETNNSSIINYVNKVLFYEDIYYILDSKQATLFRFDKEGRFIDKLARKGSGPGEYSDVYDFNINKFTGNIELLNPWGELLIYSTDLMFIEKIDIEQRAVHQFFNINMDTIVFYTSSEQLKLSFYSRSEQRIFHKAFPFDQILETIWFPSTGYNNAFHNYYGKILFEVPYSYIIYDITDCQLTEHHIWDFGKYNFKIKKFEKNKTDRQNFNYFPKLKDEVFHLAYFYETDKLIFTRYLFDGDLYSLIYDKRSHAYDIIHCYEEGVYGVDIFTDIEDDTFLRIMELNTKSLGNHFDVLSEDQKELVRKNKPEDNLGIIKYQITNVQN